MKKALYFLILFIISLPLFATGDFVFYLEFTKTGENDIGFCTAESSSQIVTTPFDEELSFGTLGESPVYPLEIDFGIYWDIFANDEIVNPSVSLEFSSSRTGTTESCMLRSPEGNALNFDVEAQIYNREDPEAAPIMKSIILSDEEIYSSALAQSRKIISLYNPTEGLEAFGGVRQGAAIKLSLKPPKDEEGNFSSFVGSSYEGYAIIHVTGI